jgi:hypothetical protein
MPHREMIPDPCRKKKKTNKINIALQDFHALKENKWQSPTSGPAHFHATAVFMRSGAMES